MAAHHQIALEPSIIDLRRAAVWELDPLLLQETVEWRQRLDWDYSKSADLVRKFTTTGSLAGAALVDVGTIVGYGYTVVEEHKGLIGDLYVRPELRGTRSEGRLFLALVQELLNTPGVRRIESQLLLVDRATTLAVARDAGLRVYERTLMLAGVEQLENRMPPCPVKGFRRESFRLEPWGAQWSDAAAAVITLAYRGHVDSEVNDQYRLFGAAAKFVNNLVDFPGCGTFHAASSLVAIDRATGRPAGIALCSFVAPGVGHVTQLCVSPEVRGQGLGYILLREAIRRLAAAGAERLGLTVTLSNTAAMKLYHACGLREVRRFFAYSKDI